jgi:hypothetical protein
MKTKMAGYGPKLAIGGVLAVTALVVGASIDWRALAGKPRPRPQPSLPNCAAIRA